MTTDANGAALAAILDSLTLMRGQLDTLSQSSERIERTHELILSRLDTIDSAQAGVTDLLPLLEMILARAIEDRDINRDGFARTAELAAFAHAAASGMRAPLPTEVVDDPLLERFLLTQPADHASQDRPMVEWRDVVRSSDTAELTTLLAGQYQPSPTDTPDTRVLRYRLAAVTRMELETRGAAVPAAPSSTVARDRTADAQRDRSEALARLWRAGASSALFADPELAGAVELFAEAQGGGAGGTAEPADLAALHLRLGARIESGERPSLSAGRSGGTEYRSDIGTGRQL